MHPSQTQFAAVMRLWRLCAAMLAIAAAPARAAVYELPAPDQHLIGEVQYVEAAQEDTFVALGRRYGVGYEELVRANPKIDPWLPGEGTRVTIPTQFLLPDAPRRGLVLNVPEMRLYYYPNTDGEQTAQVMTFPVSIGRMDWNTPLGLTRVVAKQVDPPWRPPASIRRERIEEGRPELPLLVPPGPDNPLGSRAIRLALPGYLIHGTNKPAGVGMRVTHGCVRMFPEDIEDLFDLVNPGEQVRIVNQPFKMGWHDDALLLEVHPVLEDDVEAHSRGLTALTQVLVANTDERRSDIDWNAMQQIHAQARGMPQPMQLASARAPASPRSALVPQTPTGLLNVLDLPLSEQLSGPMLRSSSALSAHAADCEAQDADPTCGAPQRVSPTPSLRLDSRLSTRQR